MTILKRKMRQLGYAALAYDRSRSIDWQKTPQEGFHESCPEMVGGRDCKRALGHQFTFESRR